MLIAVILIIFAALFAVTIIITRYLLRQINNDCINETNELVLKIYEYKKEIRHLRNMIRELSGIQCYGNKNICLRRIEDELINFENEMDKKEELPNNLASDR